MSGSGSGSGSGEHKKFEFRTTIPDGLALPTGFALRSRSSGDYLMTELGGAFHEFSTTALGWSPDPANAHVYVSMDAALESADKFYRNLTRVLFAVEEVKDGLVVRVCT